MIPYPKIDPILLSIGPLHIRWYGLAYIIGIVGGFALLKSEIQKKCQFSSDQIMNLMTSIIIGIILGGRLGYVLFYGLSGYLKNPAEIVAIWQGGMSYHGGAIGAAIALIIYAKKQGANYWDLLDLLGIGSTIGIALGRLANFINGELYGRITDVPWGMIFPNGGPLARHPSQLYEAFFEGLCLFLILYVLMKKANLAKGQLFGIYCLGYGLIRALIESFREPDAHIGFVIGQITMGQCLCAVMVIVGIVIVIKKRELKKA